MNSRRVSNYVRHINRCKSARDSPVATIGNCTIPATSKSTTRKMFIDNLKSLAIPNNWLKDAKLNFERIVIPAAEDDYDLKIPYDNVYQLDISVYVLPNETANLSFITDEYINDCSIQNNDDQLRTIQFTVIQDGIFVSNTYGYTNSFTDFSVQIRGETLPYKEILSDMEIYRIVVYRFNIDYTNVSDNNSLYSF